MKDQPDSSGVVTSRQVQASQSGGQGGGLIAVGSFAMETVSAARSQEEKAAAIRSGADLSPLTFEATHALLPPFRPTNMVSTNFPRHEGMSASHTAS